MDRDLRIRDARVEEIPVLVELQRRSSLVWDDHRDDLLAHPDVVDLPLPVFERGRVRVAEDERGTIGFAVVLPTEDDAVELDGLFVEPDAMGEGIGRALVSDAVDDARRRGVEVMTVVANRNALGFYERVGFRATRIVATRFGAAVGMRRQVHG